jgi:hypothetical protein
MAGARRWRVAGTTAKSRSKQQTEISLQDNLRPERDASDVLLRSLYDASAQVAPGTKVRP